MRAIFIRHGESTGNAGVPCHDLAIIELTERGQGQASAAAASWAEAPTPIVTSPFTRTWQTAAPTIAGFPGVPVETWPIEEFTYLQPARWNGTRSADRMPHLERYWREADPAYCDGRVRRASPPCYGAARRCVLWTASHLLVILLHRPKLGHAERNFVGVDQLVVPTAKQIGRAHV